MILLAKYFIKNIFQQKLMFIAVLCITFLASLFISGIVGYVQTSKNSFNKIAQTVNFQQEYLDFSYQRMRSSGFSEDQLSALCGGFTPGETSDAKTVQLLTAFLNDKNIKTKYHEHLYNLEHYQFKLGIETSYEQNNVQHTTKAVVIDPAADKICYDESSQLYQYKPGDNTSRIYNKFYVSDKNSNSHLVDVSSLQDTECYISSAWAKHSMVNIGDSINLTTADTTISLKVDGIADDLTFMGPVDGSMNAIFGLPKIIPGIIVSPGIYSKSFGLYSGVGYDSSKDFDWRFSLSNKFSYLNINWYSEMDFDMYSFFEKAATSTTKISFQKTASGLKRHFMVEWDDSFTTSFLSFFLWTKLISIYLLIGIILSVIFWVLAVIILFLTIRRIIIINQGRLATLKSLGYSAFTLAVGMLVYPILISLLSIGLGLSTGYGLQYFLNSIYTNSFNFPIHITFSPFIWFLLIGLLFFGTVIASFIYNYYQMSKPIIQQFNIYKLRTPKVISSLKPILSKAPFNIRFTFLFALKNWGKIISSFFIMILSFSLLVISMVALYTSLNMSLAISRGYSYNQCGYTSTNLLKILSDNPNAESGEKDLYLLNLNNGDYSDDRDRLKNLGKHEVNHIDLTRGYSYYFTVASDIWKTAKTLGEVLNSYADYTGKYTVSGISPNVHNALVALTPNEISKIKLIKLYFGDNKSGSRNQWDELKGILTDIVQKDPTVSLQIKQTFIKSVEEFIAKMSFSTYRSVGFGFENTDFNSRGYASEYRAKYLKFYKPNGMIPTANPHLITLPIDIFAHTPATRKLYDYDSAYFINELNKYQAIDFASKPVDWGMHPDRLIEIPIIVNRSFSSLMYSSTGPISKNDYFEFHDVDSLLGINLTIRLKVIDVFDSYGQALAWTSPKFANMLNYYRYYSESLPSHPSSKLDIMDYRFAYFADTIHGPNDIGISSKLDTGDAFIRYLDYNKQPGIIHWHGQIGIFDYPYDSNTLYTLGFSHLIKIINIIFIIISIFTILLSLSATYIFFNIIITDDTRIFAALNVLGYPWSFSIKQIIKIYFVLITLIIITFLPVLVVCIEKFDDKFRQMAPIDINIYYNSFIFILSVVMMVLILIINFITILLYLKKQKAIKILAIE